MLSQIKYGGFTMLEQLFTFMQRPELYQSGTMKLWDDEHISKGMLESHLDPDSDGATRKHAFVRQSVEWIARVAPVQKYHSLLDLGCGAGIYAEVFNEAGYRVTGLDLSERSINYARNSSQTKSLPITYQVSNYLTLDYTKQFDLVTMINYDFGVLSTENRAKLLRKIFVALNPNGRLIFDVFTPAEYSNRKEYRSWEYTAGGFYSAEPYLCLNSLYRYDEQNTFLNQHLVITQQDVKCLNIWEHTFTKNELVQDLMDAGFAVKGLYGNIAGDEYSDDGKQMCFVAQKEENQNGIS